MKNVRKLINRNQILLKLVDILVICGFGFYAFWMEKTSFGNPSFQDVYWLLPIIIIVGLLYLFRKIKVSSAFSLKWLAVGALFWSLWRFSYWIFAYRGRTLFLLLSIATTPMQFIYGLAPESRVLLLISFSMVLMSVWGIINLLKITEPTMKTREIFSFAVIILIVTSIAIYTGQPQYLESCQGYTPYFNGLYCQVSQDLGIIGTIWITGIFLLWGLKTGLAHLDQNGVLASLCIVVLEPVWIELFFNPSRILSVPYLTAVKTPSQYSTYIQLLERNIQLLNLIPIISFFVLIPIGLLVIKTEKLQRWWIFLISGISFTTLVGMLLHTLNITKTLFVYSFRDYFFFVLMAIQVWAPLLLFLLISRRKDTSSVTENI